MALVTWRTTAAVNPANILAAAAGNTDVAVPGVKVGDLVQAIPPDTLEASLCPQGATVPADGTVRVRITNPSAGAVDGASLVWTFVITRLGAPGGEGISWAG